MAEKQGIEWIASSDESRVRVPFTAPDEICQAWNPARVPYLCTRASGHTGRHAATVPGDTVVAVWH